MTKKDTDKAQFTIYIDPETKRVPVQQSVYRHSRPLELTHTDISGRISKPSLRGAHYFVTFLDSCTAMSAVYFIRYKYKFMECLRA